MKSQDVVEVQDRRRVGTEEIAAAVPEPEEDPEVEVSDEEEVSGEAADDEGEVEADEDEGSEADEDAGASDAEESEVAAPNLAKLRECLGVLTKRRDAIQSDVQKYEDAERQLSEELDGLKAKLFNDSSAADEIPAVAARLSEVQVKAAALRDTFTKVETKIAPIAARVQEIETAVERDRQWKASAKLRKQIAGCFGDFVDGVAAVTEPLLRRKKLAAELAAKYPLAPGVSSVRFDELVGAVNAALGNPGEFACRFYVSRLLNGPSNGGPRPVVDPNIARDLGID